MASKKPNPSFEFVTGYLTNNPAAPFADVRDAAKKKGFTIYPIVYGRAQAMLGIVKSKPRGEGKVAAAKTKTKAKPVAAASAAAPRKPGRPAKAAASPAASVSGGLNDILQHVRSIERERDQLRTTVAKMRDMLDSALSR